MEIRKVQITGGSSYVITLPKDWIKSLNIKKNDSLGLIVQKDGTLLVTPDKVIEKKRKQKEFIVDSDTDKTYLFRLLVGAYVMGYSDIAIKSKDTMPPQIRESIRMFTQIAIGPEIVDEESNLFVVKDLLSPMEMPFEKTVKRMYSLVESMHRDAIKSLKSNNKELAENVVSRDFEVDRLYWLATHQYNVILTDIMLSKKMGLSQEEASYFFLISRILERIGDHAAILGENVIKAINKLNTEIINEIESASNLALDIFAKSLESHFKKDIKKANENIDAVEKLLEKCEKINNKALNFGIEAVPVVYIVESIRRTGEYSGDISELTINYLILKN
ncbi:MAG: transcriptional regulator PhoU [Candidatus Methanofastidiosum methylothiophilum]|uniref:Transcriptional regulator PhoU n=1 Tax=Candidatus Methanofastidiosum methylothiophilum TaxID=1705564 RepID=A0A150IQK8_9EURY|nr:MAG: transcriptional regulator PhoU [Candidatus Methanofastidiosum methylthiophilus]KYC47331.1 MAG: transcriptional regulator PhoU [Candidatus Methanofastidiosum methylthiophilus]KYC49782.1 MAG: transcriptional regulator PhoU [Candidatus Methanofastidiosum methylthiophilus]